MQINIITYLLKWETDVLIFTESVIGVKNQILFYYQVRLMKNKVKRMQEYRIWMEKLKSTSKTKILKSPIYLTRLTWCNAMWAVIWLGEMEWKFKHVNCKNVLKSRTSLLK